MSLAPKTIAMVAGLLLVLAVAPAQNLVINGNFEDGNTCKEFNLPCGPSAWVTLPVKTKVVFYGTDNPKQKQGNHHFGAILENINQPHNGRTYVQTMLCRPLSAGRRYRLSMRCRTSPAPFEQAGVLLSNDEVIDGIDTLGRLKCTFVITADSIQDKGDRRQWLNIQYTFTASGGEQFLVLGNFSKTYAPRNKEYAHDVFGDIVLSLDDVSLVAEQPEADSDTSCDVLRKRLYARQQRHTPYIYLLGEPKTVTVTPAAPVKPPVTEAPKTKVTPPPPVASPAPVAEKPVALNDTLRIPFDVNSSRLRREDGFVPDSILSRLLSRPYKSILIAGYTDSTGTRELNKALSLQRAHTVAAWLIHTGKIPGRSIRSTGRADEQPVATNGTEEGRRLNRRVELIIRRRD